MQTTIQRNHDRRPENINISISLPREVLNLVDHQAQSDSRSRSNLIALILSKYTQPATQ